MRNLYVLPTDNSSRLLYRNSDSKFILYKNLQNNREFVHLKTQHIYITNDDKVKEGDWVYFISTKEVVKVPIGGFKDCKKIILTTDLDLIKGSIQSIDNNFLEWFVNNSCESVTTRIHEISYAIAQTVYEIIIPSSDSTSDLTSKEPVLSVSFMPKSPDFISSKYKGLRSPDNNRDKTYSPLHDSIMDAISENLQEHASESFSKVWSSSMFPERLTKEILRLVEDQINR
jgi:hypothetical protein